MPESVTTSAQGAGARRCARPDDGVALPLVVGTTAVLMLFLLGALAATLAGVGPARADQDAKAAVAAAQAGIDEYITRLNASDGQYWDKGNTDAANPALTTAGAPVPGSGTGRFRYRLLTSRDETAQNGAILLEVTGTASAGAGGRVVSRTLTARLQPRGFLNFVYFTDIEATDPALYGKTVPAKRNGSGSSDVGSMDGVFGGGPTRATYLAAESEVLRACSQRYEGRRDAGYTSGPSAPYYQYDELRNRYVTKTDTAAITFRCRDIQWVTGDVVSGPLHTNDALRITGTPRFTDSRVETSWPGVDPQRLWWGDGRPAGPGDSPPGHLPRYAEPLQLPVNNQSILKRVRPNTDGDLTTHRPGCLYTGATRITFKNGQMEVHSPNTTAPGTPADCLDVANRATPQSKPIPLVIHVAPAAGTCTGVGYPRSGLGERTDLGTTTDYAPCRGTVFVDGQVDGQVTVSAQDDIVITGNLTIADGGSGTDVIGLVAGNNVWVYHPVKKDFSGDAVNLLPYAEVPRKIEASILALRHSFLVQNWDKGAKLSSTDPASSLRVFGAITQKFRGPVGTGSGTSATTGYIKDYVYDPRLRVQQPPYFLQPDAAPWVVAQVTDG